MYNWTQYAANRTASENLREMTFSPHTKYKCTYGTMVCTALETPYEPPTSTMTAYLFFFDLNEQ